VPPLVGRASTVVLSMSEVIEAGGEKVTGWLSPVVIGRVMKEVTDMMLVKWIVVKSSLDVLSGGWYAEVGISVG
jgi:hypothetical protein